MCRTFTKAEMWNFIDEIVSDSFYSLAAFVYFSRWGSAVKQTRLWLFTLMCWICFNVFDVLHVTDFVFSKCPDLWWRFSWPAKWSSFKFFFTQIWMFKCWNELKEQFYWTLAAKMREDDIFSILALLLATGLYIQRVFSESYEQTFLQ